MAIGFDEFADRISDEVLQRMQQGGHAHINIGVKTVEGSIKSYEALTAREIGSEMAVSANLSRAYEAYQSGIPLSDITESLALQIGKALDQMTSINADSITDYESAKNKLIVELVSADRNREMLEKTPHMQMADMAVVFRVMVDPQDITKGTVLVSNSLQDQYGITQDQLQKDALENAARIRPAEIRSMSEALGMESKGEEEILFVASVPDAVRGAGVIAYPGFLDQAAGKLEGDFFVLPSSIHEVLLVKDDGRQHAKELNDLVSAVNQTKVSPEEQLSDNAYHYDSKDHIFERADQFEKRQREEKGRGSLLENLSEKTQRVSAEKEMKPEHSSNGRAKGGEAI